MKDILVGKFDSFLGGVFSFNMLFIIAIAHHFVVMKNRIRAMRKKKKYRGKFETIESLTVQNYRFIFISLISLLLCFFLVISRWFSFYDYAYKASSYDWKVFFFRELFIVAISLFTSILSLLSYVSNKIAISKLNSHQDQLEIASGNAEAVPSVDISTNKT